MVNKMTDGTAMYYCRLPFSLVNCSSLDCTKETIATCDFFFLERKNYHFFCTIPWKFTEWNCSCTHRLFYPAERVPTTHRSEICVGPLPICKFWGGERIRCPIRNGTTITRSFSQCPSPYTIWAVNLLLPYCLEDNV
jgi:hypothetical protein